MKKFLLAATAFAAATPAYAQGVAPVPFTGGRVEGRVGFDRSVVTVSDGADEDREGRSGVVYGGEAGFDFDLGSLVAGGYVGIEGSSVRRCTEVFGLDEACLRTGRNITLGGRVGGRLGERTLVYAKGGYSNGQLRVTYEDFEGIIDDIRSSEDLDGFHLGAGIEALLGQRIYGKVEYVYTNYGTGRYDQDFGFDADLERHQVVAGIGVRF